MKIKRIASRIARRTMKNPTAATAIKTTMLVTAMLIKFQWQSFAEFRALLLFAAFVAGADSRFDVAANIEIAFEFTA